MPSLGSTVSAVTYSHGQQNVLQKANRFAKSGKGTVHVRIVAIVWSNKIEYVLCGNLVRFSKFSHTSFSFYMFLNI